jgi:hypothetical protein
MKEIIQQLVEEGTKKILGMVGERGIGSLYETIDAMNAITHEYLRGLISILLRHMDATLCASKAQRKEDNWNVQERNIPRRILTTIGQVCYERTYYINTETKERRYLLDEVIGVARYERIASDISAKLAGESTQVSFAKAAEIVTDSQVSRQTALNKTRKVEELASVPEKADATPAELHVFADEDHVHMQDGSSQIIPLVVVAEGIDPVYKGRNALRERVVIQGYKTKPEELWQYVYALIAQKYDVDAVKAIYIHGDAAAWIKTGLDWLPNASHVLDKYHFLAKMKALFTGELGAKHSCAAWRYVRNGNMTQFQGIIDDLANNTLTAYPGREAARRSESVRKNGGYIIANWDAITASLDKSMPGSCTEPLVSHILSTRFSRNPAGWSEAGLAQLSSLRAFVCNGGTIRPENIGSVTDPLKLSPGRILPYDKLVRDQLSSLLSSYYSCDDLKPSALISAKNSPTRFAIRSLSTTRSVA